jgi:hypothetical protein
MISTCLISPVPPPFPPTSRTRTLFCYLIGAFPRIEPSDHRIVQLVGRPASSHRLAQTKPHSARSRRATRATARQLGSVRNSIASLEMAMLYIGRFRAFSIPSFHPKRPFSPILYLHFHLRRRHRLSPDPSSPSSLSRSTSWTSPPFDHFPLPSDIAYDVSQPVGPSSLLFLFSSSSLPVLEYLCRSVSSCV